MSFPLSFLSRPVLLASSLLAVTACASTPKETTAQKQQALVDQATFAVQSNFLDASVKKRTAHLLESSKAIIICPDISNMSLIFGGSGGRCVLLGRDARNSWSDPAFYHLSSGTFGLQAGYQHSQLFLFITSRRGLQALLDHQFTFDAKAAAAFGSHDSSSQSSYNKDNPQGIYALQKANGVFAGAALGSSKLTPDSAANRAYYNQVLGAEDIVINMRVNNVAADPLRRALLQAASH